MLFIHTVKIRFIELEILVFKLFDLIIVLFDDSATMIPFFRTFYIYILFNVSKNISVLSYICIICM